MICAWIETSSAVVGSSATISLGSPASASAMTTRWRMPPGELVRVLVEALLGGGNAGLLEQPDRAPARLGGADRQVRLDRLDQLLADRVERVERGQRILEDGADRAAAHPAHLLVGQVVDAPAVEADLAAGDAPRRVEQADDRRAGQRLAGARFADDAQDLAGRDRERDVVERDQRAAARGELDPEMANVEQRVGHAALEPVRRACSRSPAPDSRCGP